jgi:hypothetical protein
MMKVLFDAALIERCERLTNQHSCANKSCIVLAIATGLNLAKTNAEIA